jgi:hypothetical protein
MLCFHGRLLRNCDGRGSGLFGACEENMFFIVFLFPAMIRIRLVAVEGNF